MKLMDALFLLGQALGAFWAKFEVTRPSIQKGLGLENGNPLTYDGYIFTWEQGRQLKTITRKGNNISYKYNDSGIRTEKTVNGKTTKYHLVGDKVTQEVSGTDTIYYIYEAIYLFP